MRLQVRNCYGLIYTSCLSGFPISSSESLAVLVMIGTTPSIEFEILPLALRQLKAFGAGPITRELRQLLHV